jgi:CheY-like chemotaxis protein
LEHTLRRRRLQVVLHEEEERQEGVKQKLKPIPNKASRKVGLVEDNAALLELYKKILTARGHEIIFFAKSGEELVDAARKGKLSDVEVLITDNRMGSMSGLEAARILVRRHPDIQVIIASAEDDDLERHATQCGFVFLRKPFSLLKLADTVLR